jgi:hypothetical protein
MNEPSKPDCHSPIVKAELEDITIEESSDFIRLEKIIERGLATFHEVGNALMEICDRRLYRIEHRTFEAYCRDKWKMGRTYAHRLMNGAATCEMLPAGNKPVTERQVRPLAKLPPEKRPEAWQRAVDRAEGGQPTAADVEAAVEKVVHAPSGRPVVKIDAADRIWAVAKGHLDKIINDDVSLVRVLDEVIAYCESRKAKAVERKSKLSGRQARRLTFTIGGRLIDEVSWADGEPWQPEIISITALSKAELVRSLKMISPTAIANKVWLSASVVEVQQ